MEVDYGATGASEAPSFKTQPTGYEAAERETADRGEDPMPGRPPNVALPDAATSSVGGGCINP